MECFNSPIKIAILILLICSECLAASSFAVKALPTKLSRYNCQIGSSVTVFLSASVAIPDGLEGGTLSWPMVVSDSEQPMLGTTQRHNYTSAMTVDSVRVIVRGLYHETATDLRVRITHNGKSVTLLGGSETVGYRVSERAFGKPLQREYMELNSLNQRRIANARSFQSNLVPGIGFEYEFDDVSGTNLALGPQVVASQSSTMNGNNTAAWRVVDKNVLSSGAATHTEEFPWIQLDFGSSINMGTVVVWTPDPENQMREVQYVETKGRVTIGGSFRLRVFNNGIHEDTAAIAHDAVPTALLEDHASTELGVGRGESMQSKLQALGNIGLVGVTRLGPDTTGGYRWYITFLTEYANLDPMVVLSNNLTAGALRSEKDQVTHIAVETVVNGTKNTFYNQDMRFASVLLSDVDFGTANHSVATQLASVEKSFQFFVGQRQVNIPLPPQTSARYLRVVLRQESYLSVSEIMVFQERKFSVNEFEGGSPVPGGVYAPESSLRDTFEGSPVVGLWYLEVQDLVGQSVSNEGNSLRREQMHGTGALSDWVLELQARDELGNVMNFTTRHYVDLSATIVNLPVYGKLFLAEEYQQGIRVEAKPGQQVFLSGCYKDCEHKFWVGNQMSTSDLGSRAEDNKLVAARKVVYEPTSPHYSGTDFFTYRLNTGVYPSDFVGRIEIDVKKCRQQDCENDLEPLFLNYKHDI